MATLCVADIVTKSYLLTEIAANQDPAIAEQNRLIQEQKKSYEEKAAAESNKSPNELVVESWATVAKIPDHQKVAGKILFKRIFELNGDALQLFSFAKDYSLDNDDVYKDPLFLVHSKAVIDTVTAAVGLLEKGDMDTLVSVLRDLGAKHAKFNFTTVHYNLVGESLLFTLGAALGSDFTEKVKESWVGVYSVITEQMMAGAEEFKTSEERKEAEPAAPLTEREEEEKKAAEYLVSRSYLLTEESANQDSAIAEQNRIIAEQKSAFEKKEEDAETSEAKRSAVGEKEEEGEATFVSETAQYIDTNTLSISTEDKIVELVVPEESEEPAVEKKQSVITWMLKKLKKSSKSGLTFSSKNSIVTLKAVEGRAFQKTNLTSGLEVLSIAGKDVATAAQAAKAFASAPVGPVKIVTVGSHHTAKKRNSNDKAGIAIQAYHLDNSLFEICKVNTSGMFPDLQAGQLLWSINGKRITSVPQGMKLMQNKVLMMVVVDPVELGCPMDSESEVTWV